MHRILTLAFATLLATGMGHFGVSGEAAHADELQIKAHIPWGWISDFEFYRDGVFVSPHAGNIGYFAVDEFFNLSHRYTIAPGGSHHLAQFCVVDSFLFALDASAAHGAGTPVFFVYRVSDSGYQYLAGLEPSGTVHENFDPIIYHDGNIIYHDYPGDYYRIDVTDPSDPYVTGTLYGTSDVSHAVIPYQDSLLVSARQHGMGFTGNLRVILNDPPAPLESVGVYGNRPSYTGGLTGIGPFMFTAHHSGMVVYDISDLGNVQEVFSHPTAWGRCVEKVENHIFMGANDGWHLFEYVDPGIVQHVESLPNGNRVLKMRLRLEEEELWCSVDGGALGGFVVFDVSAFMGGQGIADEGMRSDPIALRSHPNPSHQGTTIRYQMPGENDVSLRIFDVSGQLVRTLIDAARQAGAHTVIWDARDDDGRTVSPGLYFYGLQAGPHLATGKVVMVR
jgi:hypothetical protein